MSKQQQNRSYGAKEIKTNTRTPHLPPWLRSLPNPAASSPRPCTDSPRPESPHLRTPAKGRTGWPGSGSFSEVPSITGLNQPRPSWVSVTSSA